MSALKDCNGKEKMHLVDYLKKAGTLSLFFTSCFVQADQFGGLIGGLYDNSGPAYAAFVSPSGVVTQIMIPTNDSLVIRSVSLNGLGQGLIGGDSFFAGSYAALVSPTGALTSLHPGTGGSILSVAINNSNEGLIGGGGANNTGPVYAAFVSPSGVLTPLSLGFNGQIRSVAISSSSQGLISGFNFNSNAYAAFVTPSGPINSLPVGFNGSIWAVAINDSNEGLIGGNDNMGNAYAAVVSSPSTINALTLSLNGQILSTAINNSGQGLIGGANFANPAYAAFVSPLRVVTPLTLTVSNGQINSVAINNANQGIIGGQDFTGPAYAALVSLPNTVMPLSLGFNGEIISVAINDFGQALIGGNVTGGNAYAALVSSTGIVTPLSLSGIGNGIIESVSLGGLAALLTSSQIPTSSLSGNNLTFANYINTNAPQDAFYFIPASLDGTLSQALASAAPTRNAFSLYSVSNNLFYLITSLSTYLRDRGFIYSAGGFAETPISSHTGEEPLFSSSELFADASDLVFVAENMREELPSMKERPYTIWFEAIGALAHQKAQSQTPGFDPYTGGGILAFDAKASENWRIGGGTSYLFTHIHEKQDAGHSNINQEDLFVYASWDNRQFYVDSSLWGGWFQTDQVRDIHMTGFNFKSTSHPKGGQFLPHLEIGYNGSVWHWQKGKLTLNPFAMLDWAKTWQGSFKEKGDGPFNAGQKSHHSSLLRTEVGLRLYEAFYFDAWNLVFQEKGSYVNTHSYGTGTVNAFLVGSPGSFTVETLKHSQNLGVLQLTMILNPHKSRYPTTTVFYQGEYSGSYQSHQVALELDWFF